MLRRFLLLPCSAAVLCQCQSERTVTDGNANRGALVGGEAMIEKKFIGWKPEDASWWAAASETDPKKRAEAEKKIRRTSFEKKVMDSRHAAATSKDSSWQERQFGTKEFTGTKENQPSPWPWAKKEARTSQTAAIKPAREQERVAGEADSAARETGDAARDSSKDFAAGDFREKDRRVRTSANQAAEKAMEHDDPKIVQDVGSTEKPDEGWSIKDIRKLLNK
ncbi:MAG: hypothetical protein KA004_05880 [Verrucomicrobiales bacterium]|nr:hypothetical protein [Verrucomicrobiales bacterium]